MERSALGSVRAPSGARPAAAAGERSRASLLPGPGASLRWDPPALHSTPHSGAHPEPCPDPLLAGITFRRLT